MTHAEKVLDETSGEIEFSAAKKEQKVNIGILESFEEINGF